MKYELEPERKPAVNPFAPDQIIRTMPAKGIVPLPIVGGQPEQKEQAMRDFIYVTLYKTGKKFLLEPCCDQCAANVNIEKINSLSGEVLVAHCPRCGNYLKATEQAEQKKSEFVHNKIEFPEYNDGLLEEFDKQFFESGQDDDLTETALAQKDVK